MEAAEASGWKRMTWRNQAMERNFTFTAWPTGHSLDIVTQWRKLFFFEMLRLVVAFFLVFLHTVGMLWGCFLSFHVCQCHNFIQQKHHNDNHKLLWRGPCVVTDGCFQPERFSSFRPGSHASRKSGSWTLNASLQRIHRLPLCVPWADRASACFSLEKKRTNKNPTNPLLIYKSCNFFFFYFLYLYIFVLPSGASPSPKTCEQLSCCRPCWPSPALADSASLSSTSSSSVEGERRENPQTFSRFWKRLTARNVFWCGVVFISQVFNDRWDTPYYY